MYDVVFSYPIVVKASLIALVAPLTLLIILRLVIPSDEVLGASEAANITPIPSARRERCRLGTVNDEWTGKARMAQKKADANHGDIASVA